MRKLQAVIIGLLAIFCLGLGSCSKKDIVSSSATTTTTSSTSSYIAVEVDSTSGDSVYILQPCATGYFRDSIAVSALPATITSYLDTAYSGFSYLKEFEIKDSAGTVGGYVVIISYNSQPVALLFNASGVLVRVLEQREAGDRNGNGWHEGGRFGHRDGLHKDTVALSALPTAITTYFTDNYPQDTLLKAFKNYDSSYLVISNDSGHVYATLFTSGGVFVKRIIIRAPEGQISGVDQSALPSAILTYLTTTYPGYVFEAAVSLTVNSTVEGYEVVIDANNTKYALIFDGSGNFVSSRTIW
ncbi:MAG TPA: PepSY-like domain-containing protein [Puia sp.]|nr:PepSY-like domain-containing protein [Puia sp.]